MTQRLNITGSTVTDTDIKTGDAPIVLIVVGRGGAHGERETASSGTYDYASVKMNAALQITGAEATELINRVAEANDVEDLQRLTGASG